MTSQMMVNICEQKTVLAALAGACPARAEALHAALAARKRLYILGTGASLNAALTAIPVFARYAGFVPAVLPASEAAYYLPLLADGDVLLISQSGGSFETKQLCAALGGAGIAFAGMTNEPDSHLATHAATPILMDAAPEVSSATKTESASIFLLYMAALGRQATPALMQRIAAAAAETIDCCRPQAERAAGALVRARTVYVLGDNINGPTAREGALLLKEKCTIHAEGMTVSEFRHGAVEVAEQGLPVFLIAPTDGNFDEMRKHAAYLTERGFQVWLISHRAMAEVPEERRIPIAVPEPDALRHISATIPLQIVSEAWARGLGFDPDGFRFLTKVLADY